MNMFEHKDLQEYAFDKVPLNRDIYLLSEKYLAEYKRTLLKFLEDGKSYEPVGEVGYIAIRSIQENSLEVSWYPNAWDRFHEVSVILPRGQFVACVGSWQADEKPHLFVKDAWLEDLYLRSYSVFAMIDAIGVKKSIESNTLSKESLLALRNAIDNLANGYPDVSFISFADSILLKSNWTVGTFESKIQYTYEPEKFLHIFKKLQDIYQEHLNLKIYGIFTQGYNEYYDEGLLHISSNQNHICLNSLGTPFADLIAIDEKVRSCIRNKTHNPADLYMDKGFYHSLNFNFEFDKKNQNKKNYASKTNTDKNYYYYNNYQIIMNSLRN